ncbi:unnamed protein product [Meganyctiphanes norvegica]|uniref:Ethylmalonyl-CoA decarboxylase n=1 Tax=Meganyctiphanes norvegica TaxID=48144 RepID=A0AAV2SBR5_MEGNR
MISIGLKKIRPILQFNLRLYQSLSKSTLNEAIEKLKPLKGGHISLVKDEASGIATITLEHAEKKNALSGQMMVEFADIVEDLKLWESGKGLILRGSGDTFCSGGDLNTVKNINNPCDGLLMSTLMHSTLNQLYCLPLVTVTLVHGKAIGGGSELTTATDFRVFSNTGETSFVQGKMGVVTGWGGGTRLVHLLGPRLALYLMTSCKKVSSEEALNIGLSDSTVPVDSRYEDTLNWLHQLIKHDSEVINAMKNIVIGARNLTLEESFLNERTLFSPLWGGPANMRALKKNVKHK